MTCLDRLDVRLADRLELVVVLFGVCFGLNLG